MGKIRLSDFVDDYDEYDELYGGKQKIIKKNGKNKNEENLQQSQGLPAGWREGDSYIGRRKKARN
jgi:cytochrome b involved in lipid metabolism|tara:strand:- start:58 stop:252 length:195 start_codon:yes stop_codon:yes gene_type:complete